MFLGSFLSIFVNVSIQLIEMLPWRQKVNVLCGFNLKKNRLYVFSTVLSLQEKVIYIMDL